MKLKRIHINNYKVLRNFDIDFSHEGRALDIVVVTGVNGSGKTTLLRFIPIGNIDRTGIKEGEIVAEFPESGEEIKVSFVERPNGGRNIQVSSGASRAYHELFSSVSFYHSGISQKETSKQLEEAILDYVDKLVYEEGKRSFEAYDSIRSLMDDVFHSMDLHVRFKGIDEKKRLVFSDKAQNTDFGVEGLSDGEQQILVKLLPLFMAGTKGRIILFDEPENSLHPSWQNRLLPILRRCAKRNDMQFVLATHSPQIISAAHTEEIRMLVRDDEGNIRAECCADGPYGWTVERVLREIQGAPLRRVPEIEERLEALREKVRNDQFSTEVFRRELGELEDVLGYSDSDLVLIRMEVLRKQNQHQ